MSSELEDALYALDVIYHDVSDSAETKCCYEGLQLTIRQLAEQRAEYAARLAEDRELLEGIREVMNGGPYDTLAKRIESVIEQRAELLALVDAIARGRAHCFIPTDDTSRPTFNWDERAEAAIANATQQRKEPGA